MLPRLTVIVIGLLLSGAARAASGDGGAFTSELERVSGASPQEKVEYVQTSVQEIDSSFAEIDDMLQSAKDANDNKVVQCVTSRHVAVKALQSVTQQAERDMVGAIAAGNVDRADHEFRKVAVALQRTRMLHAEAERCVGGQELADG